MSRKGRTWAFLCAALVTAWWPEGAGAQALFANAYGGTGTEWAYSLQQTADGGYVLSGPSSTASAGGYDFWIAKLDADGALTWTRSYGGASDDVPNAMRQTADGGYVLAGRTQSYGAGGFDLWVVRLDASGNRLWQRSYGGTGSYDTCYALREDADGNLYLAGWTNSYGAGNIDFWVLKLDASGASLWQRAFGGTNNDFPYAMCLAPEGGVVVAGATASYGAGGNDVWVIQVDASGNRVWQKAYGGSGHDTAFAVDTTADGGYIVAGRTESFGAGSADFWVLKLDATGTLAWQRTYGGSALDWAFAIRQTADGGYLVAGQTLSFGAGAEDAWILKLDTAGAVEWQRAYGGTSLDYAYTVAPAADGSFLVGGVTGSFGSGSYDALVLKLDLSCLSGAACAPFLVTAVTPGAPSPTATTTTRNPATTAAATATATPSASVPTLGRSVQCTYPTLPAGGEVTLFVSKSGAEPRLTWVAPGGSCTASGFGVYRGSFPVFPYAYEALDCAVPDGYFADATSGDNQYYLVVPQGATLEGSFGRSFDGTASSERPPAAAPCHPRCLLTCPATSAGGP